MKLRSILILMVLFVAGLGTGLLIKGLLAKKRTSELAPGLAGQPDLQRQKGFQLINPLLDCEVAFKEYSPFKKQIVEEIEALKKEKKIESASVYFRHLKMGYWFGINEKETYNPASVLKVPVMIAVLKHVGKDINFFAQKVPCEKVDYMGYETEQFPRMEAGQVYTIEDLLYRMVVYSDNNASRLLYYSMERSILDDVFHDLGMDPPVNPKLNPENKWSAKQIASFFRILYNASYLSRELSEYGLELLTETTFNEGLERGNRMRYPIAHKYGFRKRPADKFRELHDCGIIYHPTQPYLLCVMTRGRKESQMCDAIGRIATVVSKEVENQLTSKQAKL